MKILIATLTALLLAMPAQAQHVYQQAELDALLAPIALHPDGVLSQVLMAATYPDEVAAAARWSRANTAITGNDAVLAVQNEPWDPSVKALVAYPDLLARMGESPQWVRDLGEAFLVQQAQVMDTVQGLRRRAHASGHLASTDYQAVYQAGDAIVVQPRTQIVYVSYYDPYVVYGPWWWPYYRPVFWRPWAPRPIVVVHGFFYSRPDWHQRHVRVAHRPVHAPSHHPHVVPGKWEPRKHVVVNQHVRVPEAQRRPIVHNQPMPAANVKPHVRVPEAQRPPIVHSQPMPAANGFSHQRREVHQERQREHRTEQRRDQTREHRPNHDRGHGWQRQQRS
ncbi:MAG: DUF3300 domain-containing protein [Burkholderiales bacterium]